MLRISATLQKEWQLLRRDPGSFGLLFLMPLLLIVIMALVQDAPFRDYRQSLIHIVWVDEDHGKAAQDLYTQLAHTPSVRLVTRQQQQLLTRMQALELIHQGTYPCLIYIPKGFSAEMINRIHLFTNHISTQFGVPVQQPVKKQADSLYIELHVDPVSKPAFRMAIRHMIQQLTEQVQTSQMIQAMNASHGEEQDSSSSAWNPLQQGVSVHEADADTIRQPSMNSVQHNVPAWAIFGIFFLSVVAADHLIREKSSGSWARLRLIPGSLSDILIGKMSFYILLGCLQFMVMLWAGVYIMPLFGLPSLQLDTHSWMLAPVLISISANAAAYGLLIGTLFQTTGQALPVASISVVILSAIGGIWVPLEVLPPSLHHLSAVSPMRYSLEAIQHILLRHGSWSGLWQPCLKLNTGTLILLALAAFMDYRQR